MAILTMTTHYDLGSTYLTLQVVARTIVAASRDAKIIADDVTCVAVRVDEGGWVGQQA